MRASRLLQILLLLQNRGRMTAGALAEELEVAHRTVLRDMDALTEAGLPIIAYQGNQGGFELGFSYRTRLTGLASDEAEALAVLLAAPTPRLGELGMADAARRAASKLRESLPDQVRAKVQAASERFKVLLQVLSPHDERIAALAGAVRDGLKVRLNARSAAPREIHPIGLTHDSAGWFVIDDISDDRIPIDEWNDVNVSGQPFGAASQRQPKRAALSASRA
jgi:predicted DNA-binding transcriptional regulator YafY